MSLRVGLDIGGTKTHGVLIAADGTILAEHLAPTVAGPDGIVKGAVDAVAALRAASRDDDGASSDSRDLAPSSATGAPAVPRADVPVGVGIGVPGVVDPATGSVRYAINLGLGAEPFPLADRVAAGLRAEGLLATADGAEPLVLVENDLNASALGARAILDLGDDLAFIALGTGIAVGLVLDGRLRRGPRGLAGEVGHLPINPEGLECPCGQRGCLELYASGSGLARQYPYEGTDPIAAVVFRAADRGDEHAVVVRDQLLDGVAEAVQLLVLTLDVGAVVLGGGIARLGAPLLDGVRSRLERRERSSAFLAAAGLSERVRLAPADVPVGAVGAALALGDL